MIKVIIVLWAALQLSGVPAPTGERLAVREPILGLWKGTFTVHDGSSGTFYFSIKPNNQLLIENYHNGIQRIANGTWKLKGKKFYCTGTYFYGHPSNIGTITAHTALFDGNSTMDKGIWQNVEPNNDTGTFTLRKIK